MFSFDEHRDFLVEQLNLGLLSSDEQNEVFAWIGEKIIDEIQKNISGMLTSREMGEYEKIKKTKNSDAGLAFLYEKIPALAIIAELSATKVLKDFGVVFG